MLTKEDYTNLLIIVSTHPTPEGVGSQNGQAEITLMGKLQLLLQPEEVTPDSKKTK